MSHRLRLRSTLFVFAIATSSITALSARPEKPAHTCSSDATHIGGGKCCEPPKTVIKRTDGSLGCQ